MLNRLCLTLRAMPLVSLQAALRLRKLPQRLRLRLRLLERSKQPALVKDVGGYILEDFYHGEPRQKVISGLKAMVEIRSPQWNRIKGKEEQRVETTLTFAKQALGKV